MAETWNPVPDFPGYDVSDMGRIRSYRAHGGNGGSTAWHIADKPQRILKGAIDSQGYHFVKIKHKSGQWLVKKTHTIVMLAFHGPCPDELEI